MGKRDINASIVSEFRRKLKEEGLEGKLDVYPVENAFTRRPRYWNDGNVNLFKVHMWDLNKLEKEECSNSIDQRIKAARVHFKV